MFVYVSRGRPLRDGQSLVLFCLGAGEASEALVRGAGEGLVKHQRRWSKGAGVRSASLALRGQIPQLTPESSDIWFGICAPLPKRQ